MNTSHIDPDRLADAASDASWSAGESAHLAGCAECRFELEIVAAARRLGVAQLSDLHSERVTDAVRTRLLTEPAPAQGGAVGGQTRWIVGLALAAALVLAVVYGKDGWPGQATIQHTPVPVELSVLHELDGLDEPELEAVLESIPVAAGAMSHLEPAPFVDLNVNDLERVLRSMEE